jgi:hypothetical protein
VLVEVHGVLVLEVERQFWAQNGLGRRRKIQRGRGGRKGIRITEGEINKEEAGSGRYREGYANEERKLKPYLRKGDERRSKGKAGNGERERNRTREGGRGNQEVRIKGKH